MANVIRIAYYFGVDLVPLILRMEDVYGKETGIKYAIKHKLLTSHDAMLYITDSSLIVETETTIALLNICKQHARGLIDYTTLSQIGTYFRHEVRHLFGSGISAADSLTVLRMFKYDMTSMLQMIHNYRQTMTISAVRYILYESHVRDRNQQSLYNALVLRTWKNSEHRTMEYLLGIKNLRHGCIRQIGERLITDCMYLEDKRWERNVYRRLLKYSKSHNARSNKTLSKSSKSS
jgi:hypothetical protein